jgi:hypothetical protein
MVKNREVAKFRQKRKKKRKKEEEKKLRVCLSAFMGVF